MAEINPQVQVALIDLAWKIINTGGARERDLPSVQEAKITELTKRFDEAYKAILKTVEQK